ncbi:MAG TPA: hypothetical protein VGN76_06560 [Gemmatimonadales bacterium]|nr:hypothetical protein [Gemmatimonadales bacterium]
MYLVELRPGKEELYRSSDELALAIRSGDVDSRSRVYHRATAKWISITLHPQYKAIMAAAKEDPARPARRGWGILGGATAAEPPSSDGSVSNGNNLLHRWRRPLALGLSGVLLMSGVKLAFSGPRPPWAGKARAAAMSVRPERTLRTTRTEEIEQTMQVSLASTNAVRPEPPATVREFARVLPRAPRLRSVSLGDALASGSAGAVDANSLEGISARYAAAHDAAWTRVETGIRVARLGQLFAASRLNPHGGVTDTRMSLAGAANFIRVFREQQAAIETGYEDSVTVLARQYGWAPAKVRQWYSRTPRKESPTLELLSGSLVASIDSILGVLDAQAGAYKIRGTAIAFEDPSAGQAYGALRRRIKEQVDAAVSAGAATSPGATRLLLQAIGTSTLPRET